MNQSLYEGKAKGVEQMTKDALAEGRPVREILSEGLIAGMSVVGEDFKYNILYVPEVLISQDAYSAQLRWSDEQERAGSPREVAEAARGEIESTD